jgi:hypothetical protein
VRELEEAKALLDELDAEKPIDTDDTDNTERKFSSAEQDFISY